MSTEGESRLSLGFQENLYREVRAALESECLQIFIPLQPQVAVSAAGIIAERTVSVTRITALGVLRKSFGVPLGDSLSNGNEGVPYGDILRSERTKKKTLDFQ
jgi:hypothetical protein